MLTFSLNSFEDHNSIASNYIKIKKSEGGLIDINDEPKKKTKKKHPVYAWLVARKLGCSRGLSCSGNLSPGVLSSDKTLTENSRGLYRPVKLRKMPQGRCGNETVYYRYNCVTMVTKKTY